MIGKYEHVPKHPYLDAISSHHGRAILVLMPGCDVLPSGLKQVLDSKLFY